MLDTYVIGLIRTWTPVAIGAALTWLLRYTGVVLDDQTSAGLTLTAVVVVTGLYYSLVHALEQAYPQVGRWLLALGLTGKQPVYPAAVAPSEDGTYKPYGR